MRKMNKESEKTLSQLIRTQQIASLGTRREDELIVSMVLYAASLDFSEYYIHISELAKHTQNIMRFPQVGFLICEKERPSIDPQTLTRVSIVGEGMKIPKGEGIYNEAKDLYLEKNPATSINFQLGGFSLHRIRVKKVRYVAGFGKTFNLTKERMIQISRL